MKPMPFRSKHSSSSRSQLSPDSARFPVRVQVGPKRAKLPVWYYPSWPASLMGLVEPRPQPQRDSIIRERASYMNTSPTLTSLKVNRWTQDVSFLLNLLRD